MRDGTSALRDSILEWLESRRQAVADRLRDVGLPLSVEVEIPVFRMTSNGGEGRSEVRRVSSLLDKDSSRRGWEVTGPPLDARAVQLADDLSTQFSETLPYWMGLGDAVIAQRLEDPTIIESFDEYPLRRAALNLLYLFQLEYLLGVGDVGTADSNLAQCLATELVEFADGTDWVILTSIPVGGLRLENDEATHRWLRVRPIQPEEAGHLARSLQFRDMQLPGARFNLQPFRFPSETHIIEIIDIVPKVRSPNASLQWRAALLAFQLEGVPVYGPGYGFSWPIPPSLGLGVSMSPCDMADKAFAEAQTVTELKLAEIVTLAEAIPEEAVITPLNHKHVALHRFALGEARKSAADSLVDYVISLEGVLLPPSGDNRELRFRFGLNGAALLGESKSSRLQIRAELVRLYDLRSRIVHGGSNVPTHDELTSAVKAARDYARRALSRAVTHGWPSQEQLYGVLFE